MEPRFPWTGLTALRAKLRDTWLLHQYRRVKRQLLRRSEGEAFLLRRYARIHGKPLNLTNPQTYTEKLFWRMITWNRGDMPPRFTQLADKYAVRAHVAGLVGEQHLIKLFWHGTDPRAIPFDQLPDEYVIKPNHAAGTSDHCQRTGRPRRDYPDGLRLVSQQLLLAGT